MLGGIRGSKQEQHSRVDYSFCMFEITSRDIQAWDRMHTRSPLIRDLYPFETQVYCIAC